MSELTLYFDGRCTGNGTAHAVATYGWLLVRKGGEEVARGKGKAGDGEGATNFVAEYAGLLAGLRELLGRDLEDVGAVEIRGDSQVVIKQVVGDCGCWATHLQPLHREALNLVQRLQAAGCAVRFRWILREENAEADALAKEASGEALARIEASGSASGGATPATAEGGALGVLQR
jgi:ribonuclease HI